MSDLYQQLRMCVSVVGRSDLVFLGTDYGGWTIPSDVMDSEAVCYCYGAGEDISFDVELINRFGCSVVTLDPTPRAQSHVQQVIAAAAQGQPMAINNNPANLYALPAILPRRLHFEPVGLLDEDRTERFFAPLNPSHVSHSINSKGKSPDYFDARCERMLTTMNRLGHRKVRLLKMDIEGAEFNVIPDLMNSGIRPDVIGLEYHFSDLDSTNATLHTVRILEAHGYAAVCIREMDFTFLNINR